MILMMYTNRRINEQENVASKGTNLELEVISQGSFIYFNVY